MSKGARKTGGKCKRFKRNAPEREEKKTILIVCHGETEESYFKGFKSEHKISTIKIIPPKVSGHTDPLGMLK